MRPKVSVIVPLYNPKEENLKDCLTSIENQEYENIEIVIVDDSPSTNHKNLVNDILDRDFKFVNNLENKGISESRNIGIEECQGDLITIIDQDDFIAKERISEQVEVMENNEDVGMVLTNIIDIYEETGESKERGFDFKFQKHNTNEIADYFFFSYKKEQNPPLTTEMVRKSAYDKVGVYDTRLYGLNDRDMLLRINKDQDIHLVDKPLHYKRHHSENASNSSKEMIRDRIKFTDKMIRNYPFLLGKKQHRESRLKYDLGKAYAKELSPKSLLYFTESLLKSPKVFSYELESTINRKINL
ncbi:MAG: glycosyltransferase family 2 protein [Candidatus Nanohaloarchaea archaeon]